MTTLLLAALLSMPAHAGPGTAGSYKVEVNGAQVPGPFNLTNNCVGCPKGSPTTLAPAVYEFLMATEESPVRAHYEHQVKYAAGDLKGALKNNATSKNPILQPMYLGDLAYMVLAEDAFLVAHTEADGDADAHMAAMKDGVLLGRAAGRMTSDEANKILAKKGRAMWIWGAKWEQKDEGYITPTVAGMMMTALIPDADAKTVSLHYFTAKLNSKPDVVWDLSAVPGAFDAGSDLTYEAVLAAAAKVGG